MNLPSPRRLFAVTAMAEMFTWAGLLIAMGLSTAESRSGWCRSPAASTASCSSATSW